MNFWTKSKLQARLFFQSATLPKWIARIAAILFPLWLAVVCNYISFASLASLKTLLTTNIGAFFVWCHISLCYLSFIIMYLSSFLGQCHHHKLCVDIIIFD